MKKIETLPKGMGLTFILVTSLFALWGFANDITNPLVKAFEEIFLISSYESGFVQTAFYGGYATMAIPAALFIRKFSYKSGILIGLGLYAIGAFIFIPASYMQEFWMFLVALYILTFGLAFLETTANPFILSMGDPRTATRRLNLAQAFNPIGSLTGMMIAKFYILSELGVAAFRESKIAEGVDPSNVRAALETFAVESPINFQEMQLHDLEVVRLPYVVIGLVVMAFFFVFAFKKLPQTQADKSHDLNLVPTFLRLVKNKIYVGGVVAQTFYVGTQIMCWTYIIHYATTNLGCSMAEAQTYSICANGLFCVSRFGCTYMMKFFNTALLLGIFSVIAIGLLAVVMTSTSIVGVYCLIGVSGCMSLMFPTIYGIALDGLGEDAKLASSGLIFAIVGGALMPPLQGRIIDLGGVLGMSGVNASFILPVICFVVVGIYGFFSYKTIKN